MYKMKNVSTVHVHTINATIWRLSKLAVHCNYKGPAHPPHPHTHITIHIVVTIKHEIQVFIL